MPVLQQIAVFVLEIFWGVMLGFLLDCYQQARKICSFRNRGTSLGDFLFWLLATVLTACFLMLVNWGEVRVYVFLAMVLGVLLYFKFLGPPVRRGLGALGKIFGKPLARGAKLFRSLRGKSRSLLKQCRILKRCSNLRK
jgi:spore cortex biosynthesis protein YabQ